MFRQDVEDVVRHIPKGKVMSYGQIAVILGRPRASRVVGGIAHWGDPTLPWHRVVMKDGGLAVGYPGGVIAHQVALEVEGVKIESGKVNMKEFLWRMDR